MAPPLARVALLAAAAALVVGALTYLALAPARPGSLCAPSSAGWAAWGGRRREHAAVQPAPASAGVLGRRASPAMDSNEAAYTGMDPVTAAELEGVAADAMGRVGWRRGMLFASFGEWPGRAAGCCPRQRQAALCASSEWA